MEDEIVHGPEPLSPRATDVKPLEGYQILITFENGEQRILDMKPVMEKWETAKKKMEQPEFFNQVRVVKEWGIITWPDEMDVCPDTAYS